MPPILLNAAGTPEPSPDIQRRLRGVDPRLYLRFLAGIDSHWAICFEWSADDTRRERIQQRDLDPDKAYDIVGYLPMQCPVEEAPAYLERSLRSFPKAEIQRMADFVQQYNLGTPLQAVVDEALGDVLDQMDPTGLTIPRKRGRPRKFA